VANTSVHFPEGMLDELDRLAEERGVSRNRLIVDSCREALRERRQWPRAFFSNEHLTADELKELSEGAAEFAETIAAGRQSHRGSPL
jgi:metal-responsive CopG/Arc/MetJ family transcriptional regulator